MKEKKSQSCIGCLVVLLLVTIFTSDFLPASELEKPEPPLPESDGALKKALDSAKMRHETSRKKYFETRKQLKSLLKKLSKDPLSITKEEINRAKLEYNKKARALQKVENRLQLLQREWDRRVNMPEDVKKFNELNKFLREQYKKGVGTRDEMVAKYKQFAEDYPDSSLARRALYDAATLYTGWCERETGREPYRPDKARELHEQIVKQNLNMLTPFVVWSRGNLASLHLTADERFQGRLEFYKWLHNIDPKQYDATIQAMKQEYRFRNTKESELRERTKALIEATIDLVRRNIVEDAKFSSKPSENLELLTNTLFLNTTAAEPEAPKDPKPVVPQLVQIAAKSDRIEDLEQQTNEPNPPMSSFLLLSAATGIGILIAGLALLLKKKPSSRGKSRAT